ncbi:D-2-hydroxyacid dehydrogenase [Actinophytocola sp.]|uniref:D-2-hydroxyacid dehydrogenase n=1 Tax=Actinophytocola sp. TaxID=1872138 RepID=UPI00389A1E5D
MSERLILLTQAPVTDDTLRRLRETAPSFRIVVEPDAELIATAEVIAGHLEPDELVRATNLRWNHLWTAGADADLPPEMVERDIVLTSSAGNGAIPLAEHALLLMLMLNRDVPRWLAAQNARQWDRFRHGELAGKTVGIIGMGNAGRDLAGKCAAFHMRVLGLRNHPTIPADHVDRMYGPDQVVDLARECDFLVVTAPLTPATRGLVDTEVFAAMKPTAVIVNVSRGEIIDEPAMLTAVSEHRIAGAGLDAHAQEPLPPDSPWWSLPNVVITPHNGATTPQTHTRAIDIFTDNVARYAEGRPLINVVDKHAGYAPVL